MRICNSCDYKLATSKCIVCNNIVCFTCIIDKFKEGNTIELNEHGTCDLCYDIWYQNMIRKNKSELEIEDYLEIQKQKYIEYCLQTGSLMKCDNCGNIWDGNAQCRCWIDTYYIDEEENNYDLESQDDEEENFNPIVYGYEPTSVTEIMLFD